MKIIEQFLILVQFMTRIPVFIKIEYSEEKLAKGIKYFPIIGLIIGIILYFSNKILVYKINNNFVIAFMLIIIELLIVGPIHLDGLCDTFDGLFSYAKKEKMLEIMKDSRIGSNAGIILILYFLGKVILLSEVINIDSRILLIYPIISRFSTSFNVGISKYARETGMSTNIINCNTVLDSVISAVITIILIISIYNVDYFGKFNYNGLIIFAFGLIFILFFRKIVYNKIDGITGDTLGASLELTSIIALIVGVILK